MPHPSHISNDPLVWRPPAWIDAQQKATGSTALSQSKSDDYVRKVSDVEACAEAARAMIGFCLKAADSIESEHIKGLLQAADTGMKELQDRIKPLYSVDVGTAPQAHTNPSPVPNPPKSDWPHDDYSRKHLAETKAQVAGEAAQLAATTQAAERLAGERRRSRNTDPEPPPPTPQQQAANTPVRIPALPWLDADEVTNAPSDEFHGMIGALEQRYQRVKTEAAHKPVATPKTNTPRTGTRNRTPSPAKGKGRSPMVYTNQSLATPPQQGQQAMHWKPTPGSGPKTFTLRFDDDDYEERKGRAKPPSSSRCLSPQGPRCVSPQNRVSPAHRRSSPAKRWR